MRARSQQQGKERSWAPASIPGERSHRGRSWDNKTGRCRLSQEGTEGQSCPTSLLPRSPGARRAPAGAALSGCTLQGCSLPACLPLLRPASRRAPARRAPRHTLAAGPAERLRAVGLAALLLFTEMGICMMKITWDGF